jgi:cyclophilin family peptidyl-prolyl cis-trans isomerase
MSRFASKISRFFKSSSKSSRSTRSNGNFRKRLEFEILENRCVPSATASGVINGVAFVDALGKGSFASTDATLPGIALALTGKTTQGISINTTATTDANGAYAFNNVLPGTYAISGTGGSVILGSASVSGLSISGGQTLTENLSFLGFGPGVINMRMFLASATSADNPFAPAGSGTGLANFRPNNAPVKLAPIQDVSLAKNGSTTIDLAAAISDPDLIYQFKTSNGTINVQFFDQQAPKTVQNFLNYVDSGAYNNSFFHRLKTNFVLQGGGFTFDSSTQTITTIPTKPPISNEFNVSNTQGTLAMALSGSPSDPNSGTDEFFFNLIDNSSQLDPQSFAVFGKIVGAADQNVLNTLASTPTSNESSFNGAFDTLPLNNYTGTNFPHDATAANFLMVTGITPDSQNENLTYQVSNTNSGVVSATIDSTNHLVLTATSGQTGSSVITVKATDRYGAFVTESFTVNVTEVAPTATVAISPSTPLATDTLTATATASDSDGDPVTLTYDWQVNGTSVHKTSGTSNLTDTFNLSGIAIVGDTVTVNVTPNDGFVNGPVATSSVTVVAPTAGTISFSPANPTSADSLSANLNGSNAHSFTYEWSVNSNIVQTDTIQTPIDQLNQVLQTGDQVTLTVTPSDGTTPGTPVTASVTVA